MDATDITPALSPSQWAAIREKGDELDALKERFGELPFSLHALAALFLYEQPFGFTFEDVSDEREVADYCEAMSRQHAQMGDTKRASQFFELAGRHRVRAEKIQALLPLLAAPEPPSPSSGN